MRIEFVAGTAVEVSRQQSQGVDGLTTTVKTSYSDLVEFPEWFCSRCLKAKVMRDIRTTSILAALGVGCMVLGMAAAEGWFLPAGILLLFGLIGGISETLDLRRISGAMDKLSESDVKRWFKDTIEEIVRALGRNKWWTKSEFDAWEATVS